MPSDTSEVILAYNFSVPLSNYALWENTQNHIILIFSIYFRPCDITIPLYKLINNVSLFILSREMLFIAFDARGKRHYLTNLKMHPQITLSYMRGVKHVCRLNWNLQITEYDSCQASV